MKVELNALRPKLLESAAAAETMMKEIEKESEAAEKTAALVAADEVIANEEAAQAIQLTSECEADLAEAMPALHGKINIT